MILTPPTTSLTHVEWSYRYCPPKQHVRMCALALISFWSPAGCLMRLFFGWPHDGLRRFEFVPALELQLACSSAWVFVLRRVHGCLLFGLHVQGLPRPLDRPRGFCPATSGPSGCFPAGRSRPLGVVTRCALFTSLPPGASPSVSQ